MVTAFCRRSGCLERAEFECNFSAEESKGNIRAETQFSAVTANDRSSGLPIRFGRSYCSFASRNLILIVPRFTVLSRPIDWAECRNCMLTARWAHSHAAGQTPHSSVVIVLERHRRIATPSRGARVSLTSGKSTVSIRVGMS